MSDIETVLIHWPFPDDPDTGTYVAGPVWDGHKELLYVVHDHEGDWQFFGEGFVGDDEEEDLRYICLKDVVLRFPTVGALAKLPVGWEAEFDEKVPEWRVAPADFPEPADGASG